MNLDEPRSEAVWKQLLTRAKSEQLRLSFRAGASRYERHATRYSNLSEILSLKELNGVLVGSIAVVLPNDRTGEAATRMLAAVKRLKEVN